MMLIDTSVWIDHLRNDNSSLAELLINEEVYIHPFIIGELACGFLKNKQEILRLLHDLPFITPASDQEVLFFIEKNKLMGQGLGYVDLHLLASTHLNKTTIWTLDKKLISISKKLHLLI